MNTRLVLGGLKSYLPVQFSGYKGTGGTVTGSYCYSVWMRHLAIINRHVKPFHPSVVVELGPGDSIGLGLAALLGGADLYIGLDVLEHASTEVNLRVLDELVELFRKRAPIPDASAFPRLLPPLTDYSYPAALLDDAKLSAHLSDAYVKGLRAAIMTPGDAESPVQYRCPWTETTVAAGSADLVISQVTLQDMDHVPSRDDLRANLKAMTRWLKPGGVMSHQVDFSCPGGNQWNHHWAFGQLTWKLIRGNRPYYVNRAPLSEYLSLFKEAGLDVVGVEPVLKDGLTRNEVAPEFKTLPDSDFKTSAALLVAVKR